MRVGTYIPFQISRRFALTEFRLRILRLADDGQQAVDKVPPAPRDNRPDAPVCRRPVHLRLWRIKVKMSPPYNVTGAGYTDTLVDACTTNGYQKDQYRLRSFAPS